MNNQDNYGSYYGSLPKKTKAELLAELKADQEQQRRLRKEWAAKGAVIIMGWKRWQDKTNADNVPDYQGPPPEGWDGPETPTHQLTKVRKSPTELNSDMMDSMSVDLAIKRLELDPKAAYAALRRVGHSTCKVVQGRDRQLVIKVQEYLGRYTRPKALNT